MLLNTYIIGNYIPYRMDACKKDSNLKRELQMLKIIQSYEFSEKDVENISISDIAVLLAKIEKDRNVSKTTINRYRARLSNIFSYAIQNKIIVFNPVKYIKKNREYPRGKYLSIQDAHKLLTECKFSKNHELYTIVVLALNTGMRAGEILNLTFDNIENNSIALFGTQTKSGLPRTIPLNSCSLQILKNHLNESKCHYGKIFKSKSIRSCFECAKKRSGLIGLRFHDLRRTCATHLKDGGIDIHTISKILGHTSISTTERYLGINEKKILDSLQILSFS